MANDVTVINSGNATIHGSVTDITKYPHKAVSIALELIKQSVGAGRSLDNELGRLDKYATIIQEAFASRPKVKRD